MLHKSVLALTSLAIIFFFAFLQAEEKEELSEIPGAYRVEVGMVPVDVIALDSNGQITFDPQLTVLSGISRTIKIHGWSVYKPQSHMKFNPNLAEEL
jgi:hypothetical protein